MLDRTNFRRRAVFALLFGLIALVPLLDRPRLQTLHTVDLLTLLASGMCFGVGLTLFIFAFKSNRA
jgi:drug/metabolite transporter (DMT)-like permease